MPKRWLWCVAAMVVAAVVWNEYRLYSRREPPAPDQPAVAEPEVISLAGPVPVPKHDAGGEEESEVTVIDLSWLQRQTAEPPVAETEEPTSLPLIPEPRQSVSRVAAPPRVADFEPHSADGPVAVKVAEIWKKIAGFVWNVPVYDDADFEPLRRMPKTPPKPCPETSVCPYVNGTGGQQYKR